MKKKLDVIMNDELPVHKWTFTHDGKSLSANDVMYTCLYDDCKTEFFCKDPNLTRMTFLVEMVEKDVDRFKADNDLFDNFLGIFLRLEASTKWHSIPLIQKQAFDLRKKLVALEERLCEAVFGSVADAKERKATVEKIVGSSDRPKMRELCPTCEMPLRFVDQPSYF
eukprot:TRINITY_DN1800_c0_g1_i1.p2 TRINITY_DN1800_c0_g1~~TRINITY_DN1800_c0_g1_i1.p2  ORF type:complete len:167 (-),score=69.58 TRINITY_DN1800_c0_g1_i1:85-585(-)